MNLELINYFYNHADSVSTHSWSDFLYESLIAFIGGLSSGALVYVGVIRWIESRREARVIKNENDKRVYEIKYECTKAFLELQMKLILQISALRGYLETVENILNCKVSEKTIKEIFSDGLNPGNFQSHRNEILRFKNINIFTDYIITPTSSNVVIDIPFQIYDMNNFDGKEILSVYFNDLSSHNKHYFDILELINRRNYIRDKFLIEESRIDKNQILDHVIYASLNMAFSLHDKIQSLMELESESFRKAQQYIDELGLTSPLQVVLDESGMPIFDKKNK